MKIYGADLYKINIAEEELVFPEIAKEGDLAYINNELYIFTINESISNWEKLSVNNIIELSDVNINNILSDDVLTYNENTSKWENKSLKDLLIKVNFL